MRNAIRSNLFSRTPDCHAGESRDLSPPLRIIFLDPAMVRLSHDFSRAKRRGSRLPDLREVEQLNSDLPSI